MSDFSIEVLPSASSIEIVDGDGTRVIEVPGNSIEFVQNGQLVVNQSGTTAQVHTQVAPAATWIIAHGLGRLPAVKIYLASGEEVASDVVASSTSVTITFPAATAGSAILT